MINYENYSPDLSFFAASNGYAGFSSIFDTVFDPLEYKMIFILKGGPGTGKSTIMKGIISHANENGIYSEAVYCSSDPYSLDGVILEDNDERIAVIDGTAPHACDPKYPGAVETIVNLGEGFNISYLTSRRDEIIYLNREKSEAYKKAYNYLKIAGSVHNFLANEYEKRLDKDKLLKIIKNILDTYASYHEYSKPRRYHIGSFSKFGYTQSNRTCTDGRSSISLSTDGFVEEIVMSLLYTALSKEKKINTVCPSPFSQEIIDAIYTDKFIFKLQGESDIQINLSDLIPDGCDMTSEKIIYRELLDLSSQSFAYASENHFKIENIYSEAMDFSYNDSVYKKLITNIEDILS